MEIKDKKIIITGAGAGLGRQLTIRLLNQGAEVIGLDINDKGLEETKKLANSNKLTTYEIDMSSKEEITKFKEIYMKKHKTLDILINNAGIIQPFIKIKDMEDKLINKIMDVNFNGPVYLTRIFIPELLKQKEASITNISSMGGFFPFPGQSIYGASKAALKLFTEGLYSELLETDINVTIVFPGAIKTDIAKNSGVQMEEKETNMKMLTPEKAAEKIIKAIQKEKFQLFLGTDSKAMNFIYKISPKFAVKTINKVMAKMM